MVVWDDGNEEVKSQRETWLTGRSACVHVCVCVMLNNLMCIKQLEPNEHDMHSKQGGEEFCTLFHVFYSTILS